MQLSSIWPPVHRSAACPQNFTKRGCYHRVLPKSSSKHAILAALVIAGVFLYFAGDGLRAYFTPDEMMNFYGAWFRPLLGSRRPVGDLLYRGIFAVWGLNPLPYRLVCYSLLGANLALIYAFCRKLSGSSEVGALACLLGAYHAHLADLYYSSDTLYDLLYFFFYFSVLLLYIAVRHRRWQWQLPVLALFVLALGSKEMAATLPVFLVLYDLIYDPRPRTASGSLRWAARELKRLWPFALATVGLIVLKTMGPLRVTGNSDFLPRFSWPFLINNWKHYAYDLFYGLVEFTPFRVILLWAILLATALLLRKRDLWFAAALILIGILPVALIPERGFYAVYLILPGWYLFGAEILVTARDRLLAERFATRPALLFALVAVCLIPLHLREKPKGMTWVAEAHESVRGTLQPLRAETVPKSGKVLILDDPFPKEDYILTFMFRLTFRDEDIQVRRAKSPFLPADGEFYDRVFTYSGWRLKPVASP